MTTAPTPKKIPTTRTHHGRVFVDNYEWMREKESPEVIAHLEAENAFTEQRLAHLAPLREKIFEEIKGRVRETDLSVPIRRGDWWYYGRSVEGKQYGLNCRAPIADPDDWTPPKLSADADVPGEQILFDANVEAGDSEFFSLGAFGVTMDGTRMLWGVDLAGDERYTVRVRDIATGEALPDLIEGISGGASFTPDGRFILYSTIDDAWRPDRVWLHRVGDAGRENDVEVFHEEDEGFWAGAGFTRSHAFFQIASGSKLVDDVTMIRTEDVERLFAGDDDVESLSVFDREDGVEHSIDHAVIDGRDWFYVLHNQGAEDFTLVRLPVDDLDAEPETVIPHTPGVRLEDVDCLRDFAVVEYRSGGIARVGILDYATHELREIAFDEPIYTAGAGGNAEWAQPTVRLNFSSFITPSRVLDYDVATGELMLRKQAEVLGGYDPDEYGQERLWVTAEDGTEVPVSIVWKRSFGAPGEGERPLFLYGYGSYEHSIDPGVGVSRLSMLDRGVVYAIAHVRGGGEMGRAWYENGKTLTKRNTFTDFVDVARHLVDAGYTAPDKMVASGGSAGGLLMGAVANLAPELFAGVLADVPFVDALTTILDPSLPLTVIEWEEWGNPLEDAEVYDYMASYSPYENVREGVTYPKILAVTSLNDTRVFYVEPAKWVARLREVGADVMLKCEMVAGHGGVSGRYNSWRETAYELAWILDTMGLAE
ncbi:S9 family peptidase [Microbacterium sorbitolivorans]|uniref:S9 family peptidase n=1 Tax=Microbacterium sorbitolivorans TaxID=1867410 RepID=A0A367XXN6_9MICO|nr:S9 family peptidase [Microbacterium sorbitolivorans]RCK58373.1 S9 family peptidase [Microbacterium sorbitolivorans]